MPAAARALKILEQLVESGSGTTTSELVDALGGSRSGTYALINTLREADYLTTSNGLHRVGPALRRLAATPTAPLPELINAFSSESTGQSHVETIALSWPDGTGCLIAAEAPGSAEVRVVYAPGSKRSEERADSQILAAGDQPGNRGLDGVRREGLAQHESAELIELSVPVCSDGIHPVAAIVAGIPAHLAHPGEVERVKRNIRELAARLSYRIGATVYQPYGWEAGDGVGPTSDLEDDELDRFLEGLWSAQLACIRADGSPHVVPLWYEWDGAHMWLAASPGATWREAIRANSSVSVTLDEPWPPLRRVFVSGSAIEVTGDEVPGGLRDLRRRLAERYLGRSSVDRPELTETRGWAAIRIDAERIHGRKGLGTK